MRTTECVGRCSSGIVLRNKAAVGRFVAGGWPAVTSDKFGRAPASSSPPDCQLESCPLLSNNAQSYINCVSNRIDEQQKSLTLSCY